MNSTDNLKYLEPVVEIAQAAGDLLMQYFNQGFEVSKKADNSPVTDADIAANQYITEALQQLAPDISVIAEEDEMLGDSAHSFWLVDPLDGTKAFVAGEPEFTVNIALIENEVPVLGVIVVPAQGVTYYACAGKGAFRVKGNEPAEKISVRLPPEDGITVVRSKSHPSPRVEEFLATLPVKEMIAGSSSVKFCQVAEGSADIYPRFGRTMEWDIAAGHAILNAAGGRVVDTQGEIMRYGKAGFENPHFIAYGYDT